LQTKAADAMPAHQTDAMTILARWALVPLSGLAVWLAVLLLGIVGYGVLDSLCPPELMVSGACTARWHGPGVDALVLLCTALASAGVVIVPARVAPGRRFHVALAAFTVGAVFALYVARGGSLWGPFFAAALAGSAGLWLVASRWSAR